MRVELHSHTLLSDGELIPIELARRAVVKGHQALAITDHASLSNLDRLLTEAKRDVPLAKVWGLELLVGVEITHVPAKKLDLVVKEAKKRGAQVIVVHGETISEPVEPGTNRAAVNNPGFITLEEVEAAKKNGVVLEITSRRAHNSTNGHVARLAQQVGARMVVNTDTHGPNDLIDVETAFKVALAAGLSKEEADKAVNQTPQEILKRARSR
jgi:putative hydrolase